MFLLFNKHFKHGSQAMNTYASQNFKGGNKKGGSGADQLVID